MITEAISPLRQRMIEDMSSRNRTEIDLSEASLLTSHQHERSEIYGEPYTEDCDVKHSLYLQVRTISMPNELLHHSDQGSQYTSE